ncbi:hypothetical protein BH23ACI1_BH23ACI1_08870 [soil metagenome]
MASNIPAGVRVIGDIVAAEDLDIQGRVDGQITAPAHHVNVGASAVLKSRIVARVLTLAGALEGSITASERVRILGRASLRGHVSSPSLLLIEGARFNGTADPNRTEAAMRVARYRQKQQA